MCASHPEPFRGLRGAAGGERSSFRGKNALLMPSTTGFWQRISSQKLPAGAFLRLRSQLQGRRKEPEAVAGLGRQRRRSRSASTRRRNGSGSTALPEKNLVFFCFFVELEREKDQSFEEIDKECRDEISGTGEAVAAHGFLVQIDRVAPWWRGGNGELCLSTSSQTQQLLVWLSKN